MSNSSFSMDSFYSKDLDYYNYMYSDSSTILMPHQDQSSSSPPQMSMSSSSTSSTSYLISPPLPLNEFYPSTNNKNNSFYYLNPSSKTNRIANSSSQSPNFDDSESCSSPNSQTIPISINTNSIQLRFLDPRDYETVKGLCEEWFPVDYPSSWYDAITSDSNFFSLAAILDHQIIGLIVAELKNGTADQVGEDRDLLCSSQSKCNVGYILSLGVVDAYRRQGIASLLLTSLLDHLNSVQCKAVYLHVLSTNRTALRFYEKHRFRVHKFLPYYYYIGGTCRDGFTYVLYLNGGHGPWGLIEYVQHFCSILSQEAIQVPSWCMKQFRRVAHSLVTLTR